MAVEVFGADDGSDSQPFAGASCIEKVRSVVRTHGSVWMELQFDPGAGGKVPAAVCIDQREEVVVDLEHQIFSNDPLLVAA